jgi:hypothetical protein
MEQALTSEYRATEISMFMRAARGLRRTSRTARPRPADFLADLEGIYLNTGQLKLRVRAEEILRAHAPDRLLAAGPTQPERSRCPPDQP